ncbi:MAG: NUDIX domain-containing protein [Nanoarchaeota archaeon]|nr:NUDIX domain-containing protein [Nanoarchaeota archaeon]
MEQHKKIQAIVFRKNSQDSLEILALRRVKQRGGNWQPITGNVDSNETFENALKREIKEEIGVNKLGTIIDLNLEFEFSKNNKQYLEKAFAVELSIEERISLEQNPSLEHDDSIWISYDGAFEMFDFVQQKEALNKLYQKFYH